LLRISGCCNYHESWFENKQNARKKMDFAAIQRMSKEKNSKVESGHGLKEG